MSPATPTHEELAQLLWDYLEGLTSFDAEAREYVNEGRIRETGQLTEPQQDLVEKMDDDIGFEMKQCYHNTQLATSFYGGRGDIEFEYVEGYVISDAVPVPIQHAWIELDGTVAELTLPQDRQDDEEWVYLGTAFDAQTVRNALDERGQTGPLAGRKPWLDS